MSRRVLCSLAALVCLSALGLAAPAAGQTCGPLDNGRMANVHYGSTALAFEPIIEFREMVLTITGPCEDIVRVFGPKDEIAFDIREIERVTDGQYSWELRRVANIDPGVQEDLQAARGTGEEDALWWSYFQKGAIPEGPYVDSGAFSVVKGVIVDPTGVEERRASVGAKAGAALAGASLAGELTGDLSSRGAGDNSLATKDVVYNDDLIVIGSMCVGFDCVNGEVFGFDTIRLKENNLRIQFEDTSSAAGFPTNNWQIRANSSSSGGESFLGFMDQGAGGNTETGTRVFAVEAGAGSNALFVESGGDVGVGTGNPVLNLHVVDGDSPGLRLEQDASSGFQAQTWDIAGNETNFFVRDVTSGSRLPFRIRPGAASSTLFIDSDSDVGIGTSSPSQALHVRGTDGSTQVFVEEASVTSAQRTLLRLENNGAPAFTFANNAATGSWSFFHANNDRFVISRDGTGTQEFAVAANGDILVGGAIVHTSSRDSKADFEATDPQDLLTRLAGIPILEWRYRADDEAVRHLGPMAEDFHAAFGLGADERTIALNDSIGVALAAIQALNREAEAKNAELEALREENAELNRRVEALESRWAAPPADL